MRNPNAPWEIRNDAARKRWIARERKRMPFISFRNTPRWAPAEIPMNAVSKPLNFQRLAEAFQRAQHRNRHVVGWRVRVRP